MKYISKILLIVCVSLLGQYAAAQPPKRKSEAAAKEAVAGLKNAAGYIRREVGQRLRLRKTPELRFVADDSIEHGMSIAKMLNDLNK